MNYNCYDMGAYNLHIINTDKFKTITIEVNFRRTVKKDEITKRTLLKDILLNSNNRYPTQRNLIIAEENLYDLKIIAASTRIGNYANLSFKMRFLNEIYTEDKMNKKSISYLMDILFNPNANCDKFDKKIVEECKRKLAKNINSIKDNKIKYALSKLFESKNGMPYSYNSYGYIEDLDKIDEKNLYQYYKEMLNEDLIDVFVVGDIDNIKLKDIFKEQFQARTFHKLKSDILVKELNITKKVEKNIENDDVNQTQLTMLYGLNNLTEFERRYVIKLYNEILGGSSNSILFDTIREKNSYAYYVNSDVKSYDNILFIYSGIEPGKADDVVKLVKKTMSDMQKGKITNEQLDNAKETLISSLYASMDTPNGLINVEFAKVLVGSDDIKTRIENFRKVNLDDVIKIASKVHLNTIYILEGVNE